MDEVGNAASAVSRHYRCGEPRYLARYELSDGADAGRSKDRRRDLSLRQGEVAPVWKSSGLKSRGLAASRAFGVAELHAELRALQGLAIPFGQIGRGRVGFLQKRKQQRV